MARKKSVADVAEKAVKKSHPLTVILAVLFLLIGAAGGAFVYSRLTDGDKLELAGERVVYLQVGQAYEEPGYEAVYFGKDAADIVVLSGDTVDTSKEGIYQIVYKVDGLFRDGFQRVRAVIVGNPQGLEEFLAAFEGRNE